jgi:hypothetical protein
MERAMADQVQMDTDGVLNGVPAVRTLGDGVAGILSRLQEKLDRAGPAWGDDPTGDAFAANYLPSASGTMDVLASTRNVLWNTADDLVTMANGYASTDADNTAMLQGDDDEYLSLPTAPKLDAVRTSELQPSREKPAPLSAELPRAEGVPASAELELPQAAGSLQIHELPQSVALESKINTASADGDAGAQ